MQPEVSGHRMKAPVDEDEPLGTEEVNMTMMTVEVYVLLKMKSSNQQPTLNRGFGAGSCYMCSLLSFMHFISL